MFIKRKTHYCWVVNSPQIDLLIQNNPNQNLSRVFFVKQIVHGDPKMIKTSLSCLLEWLENIV